VTRDGWTQYAEYARRLDFVRAQELARTAGLRESVAAMSEHADALQARLSGQRGAIVNLGTTLRLRRPKVVTIPPEPELFVDPATNLTQVAELIDGADREATMAGERGNSPILFPGLSTTMRSLVIYGAAAFVILVGQLLAFRHAGDKTSPILVLFVIPAIFFAIAWVVLAVGGRTRVTQAAVRARTRLGFVLCFAIGPIVLILVIASSFSNKK
jgi:hypothetical protein